jgi:A/G-specific adenine glycosylase
MKNAARTGPERRISPRAVADFRRAVYAHYRAHGRDLPWRATKDPYRIAVSEIMLQQTRVDRVAGKFPEFIRRLPSWRALAAAPLAEVLDSWQGLGYNRRALSLKKAAEIIMREHGGRLPRLPEELMELPGIGAATAASIAAYAFNAPVTFIETNIRAVYIHHFFPRRTSVADEELLPLVAQTLDRRNPARWYNALMDYGVMLKKAHANPARRSAHRTRQTAFIGSMRQLRGAVLRLLLRRRQLTIAQIAHAARETSARVRNALAGLIRDGMVASIHGTFRIKGRQS